MPQILNAAPDLTVIELSKKVSDSHNHPEGVALAPLFHTGDLFGVELRAGYGLHEAEHLWSLWLSKGG